ncbi:B12-binding domain-containing radical SAM protein [Candidatus Omnitrophota bacterium]
MLEKRWKLKETMNVLLLNMPVIFNKAENLEPPLGVAYIASVLKENAHNVRIVDFEVERFSEEILINVMNGFSPGVIGISCRTASYNSANKITGMIKRIRPNIYVVIGGHHVTAFPEESIKDTGCDAAIRGEGEYAMQELVSSLSSKKSLCDIKGLSYRDGAEIKHNNRRQLVKDLNKLPFPARELLPNDKYVVNSVITSRGCPFSCIYCDKSISTQDVRYRTSDNVYDEVKFLNKKYKNKLIYFVDDFFFLDRSRVSNLFDLLKNNNHKITWRCQSRVSPLDLSLLPKAKECGCELIIFGIETGDAGELDFINKKSTLEEVEKTVKATKDAGISVRANFMLGFPVSTHDSIRNTIKFAAKLPIDICRFFLVAPFPNTRLWDYVVKHDLIKAKDIDWTGFDLYSTSYKVPGLTHYELCCYAGAAYIHTLKRHIFREIFSQGFKNISKLFKLIIDTKRIRGNLSKSFPSVVNLFVELYFLTKKTSFLYKAKYLLNIVRIERSLS